MQKASFVKRAIALVIDIPAMMVLSYLFVFLFAFVMAPFYGRDTGFALLSRSLTGRA